MFALALGFWVYSKYFSKSGVKKPARQAPTPEVVRDYNAKYQETNLDDPSEKRKLISQFYKPRPVGPGTGEFRVFQTNKGLRVFEVSVDSLPVKPFRWSVCGLNIEWGPY